MLLRPEIVHQGDYASNNVRRLHAGYFAAGRTSGMGFNLSEGGGFWSRESLAAFDPEKNDSF